MAKTFCKTLTVGQNETIYGSTVFTEYIDQINNDGIKELVIMVMDKIGIGNNFFFNAPASSSGKFHPPCSNVKPGGLVRHVFRALDIGKHLSRALDFNKTQKDIVIAALIMHDIWKNDFGNHATRAGDEIMETIRANPHLFELVSMETLAEIVKCVRMHMGPYSEAKLRKEMKNYTLTELVVYESDYLSSRPEIGTPQDTCNLDLAKSLFYVNNTQ